MQFPNCSFSCHKGFSKYPINISQQAKTERILLESLLLCVGMVPTVGTRYGTYGNFQKCCERLVKNIFDENNFDSHEVSSKELKQKMALVFYVRVPYTR